MTITPSIVFVVKQLKQAGKWQLSAFYPDKKQLAFSFGEWELRGTAVKQIQNCLKLLGATACIAIEVENHKGVGMRYEMMAQSMMEVKDFSLPSLPKS
jgi:hypothetical protein